MTPPTQNFLTLYSSFSPGFERLRDAVRSRLRAAARRVGGRSGGSGKKGSFLNLMPRDPPFLDPRSIGTNDHAGGTVGAMRRIVQVPALAAAAVGMDIDPRGAVHPMQFAVPIPSHALAAVRAHLDISGSVDSMQLAVAPPLLDAGAALDHLNPPGLVFRFIFLHAAPSIACLTAVADGPPGSPRRPK